MKRIRSLGYIETVMSVQQQYGRGTTQGCKVLGFRGDITRDALLRGVKVTFWKYAMLRCAIQYDGSGYELLQHDELDNVSIAFNTVPSTASFFEHEVDEAHRMLDASRSLWRVLLLSTPGADYHHLVITCHHALLDESGGNLIAAELMKSSLSAAPIAGSVTQERPIPKAVDHFLFPEHVGHPVAPRAPAKIPHIRHIDLNERRTNYRFFKMDKSVRLGLTKNAKAAELTENAVLCAALALATQRAVKCPTLLPFKSAMSLREIAIGNGAEDASLGCYISVADIPLDVSSGSIFAIAKAYQKTLLSEAIGLCLMARAFDANKIIAAANQSLAERAFSGIGLSDLGSLDLLLGDQFPEVLENYSLTNRVAGNLLVTLQMYSFAGDIHIQFAYVGGLVPDEVVVEIEEQFIELVSEYAVVREEQTSALH